MRCQCAPCPTLCEQYPHAEHMAKKTHKILLSALDEGPTTKSAIGPVSRGAPSVAESRMGRVVAIASQKGGVGKTTTAVNLAASLVVAEQRVLVVDLDPQSNATTGLGVTPGSVERGSYELLLGDASLREIRLGT